MSVSAKHSLITIFENADTFVRIVKYIDNHSGAGGGVPGVIYRSEIYRALNRNKSSEKQKIAMALDEDNLLKAGLLLEYDKSLDSLTFQPFVIDAIRHIDSSLFKELTNKELDELRHRLSNLVDVLYNDVDYASGSPQAMSDVEDMLFNALNEINSRLEQNVKALTRRAEHLSELLDSEEWQGLEMHIKRGETLREVISLHDSHIEPALMFLDGEQRYKNGDNPIESINKIAKRLSSKSLSKNGLAAKVYRLKSTMLSKHHQVKKASRMLDRFMEQSDRERSIYQAVENHFNALVEAARSKHTMAVTRNKLPLDHEVHIPAVLFSGLKRHNRSRQQLITGYDTDTLIKEIEEDLRVYRETTKKLNLKTDTKVNPSLEQQQSNQTDEYRRVALVMKEMKGYLHNTRSGTLHCQLHEFLSAMFDDYNLSDLVTGIAVFSCSNDLKAEPVMNTINHNGLTLKYLNRAVVQ